MRITAAALCLPLAFAGDRDEAAKAFAARQFDAARERFAAAVEAAGSEADSELCFDWALAALRSDQLGEAETALARAEALARGEQIARCEFLRGNLFLARAERGAALAARPEAEPFAYDLAIRDAERAHVAWVRAALAELEPDAARRNAERALRRVHELEEARRRAEEERRKQTQPGAEKPQPLEVEEESATPPAEEQRTEEASDEPVELERTALDAEGLARLRTLLATRERQKRATRETERETRGSAGARDW